MKINKALELSKTNNFISYLNNKGIFELEDLSTELINSINFVPGIDMDQLNKYKKQLRTYIEGRRSISKIQKESHWFEKIDLMIEQEEFSPIIDLKSLLSDIPRHEYFISFCKKKNIKFVHQIDSSLLISLANIENLGRKSINKILKRINDYNSGLLHMLIIEGDDLLISKYFVNHEDASGSVYFNSSSSEIELSIYILLEGIKRTTSLFQYFKSHNLNWVNEILNSDHYENIISYVGEKTYDLIFKRINVFLNEQLRILYFTSNGLFIKEKGSDQVEKIQSIKSINRNSLVENIPIEKIFFGLPRFNFVIKHFNDLGIEKVYDLSNELIEDLIYVEKIGYKTSRIYRERYSQFMSGTFITVPDKKSLSINDENFEGKLEDLIDYWEMNVNSIRDRDLEILLQRCDKRTLEFIARTKNITRERVRQVIIKVINKLNPIANWFGIILSNNRSKSFNISELNRLEFSNERFIKALIFILKNDTLNQFEEMIFTDIIVPKVMIPDNFQQIITDSFDTQIEFTNNLGSVLENVIIEIKAKGITFLNEDHLNDFIIYNGYVIYGNFIFKERLSYGLICVEIIELYFNYDIKLDSKSSNEDLIKLRSIIDHKYKELKIGKSNRALSARLAEHMILTGRGRYAPVSKVYINNDIFHKIFEYVRNSKESSFYFFELFTLFYEDLSKNAKVDNKYLFQGIFKHLYGEEFSFERDLFIKKNELKVTIDDKLINLLLETGKPVTFKQIQRFIPGIKPIIVHFIIQRNDQLTFWENTIVNHHNNFEFNPSSIQQIKRIIEQNMTNLGYISAKRIYDILQYDFHEEFKLNNIFNNYNLFYALKKYYEEDYTINSFPHIIRKDCELINNSYSIALAHCTVNNMISRYSLEEFASKYGWSSATASIIYSELDNNFLRVDYDNYINDNHINDCLHYKINSIEEVLNIILGSYGSIPVSSIHDFSDFPDIGYQWNSYILESLLYKYSKKYCLIFPKSKDRRYTRGIITMKKNTSTFEDYIINLVPYEHNKISEYDLITLLNEQGLNYDNIPKELYVGEKIYFKGDHFLIKR